MHSIRKSAVALLPLTIALSACSGSSATTDVSAPKRPAHFYYIDDVSDSPATMNDPAVSQAVERHIANDIGRTVRLGDIISLTEAGGRDAARQIQHPAIVTGYTIRLHTATTMLLAQMHDVAARYHNAGGDDSTHLVEAIETLHPDCSSRSVVTLETDGLEESEGVSATRALALGQPFNLPTPSAGRYLAGCRVVFLGFGITADPAAGKEQLLPSRQLAVLRQGWTTYLQAAGVLPEDMEFVSVL